MCPRSIKQFCAIQIALLAIPLLCCAVSAQENPPKLNPAKSALARKMVVALNADSYAVRAKAREILLSLGREAIDPLEFAAKSEDSETRLRAVELLIGLRGRGLLGINMLAPPYDTPTEWGAGVKSAQAGMPADQAGIVSGDVILALNGEPVEDNTGLQSRVFSSGPARVMDVTVDRGGERLHCPVLLTLNLTGFLQMPKVDLERELPASDNPQQREQARYEIATRNMFVGQVQIVNGQQQVVQPPAPQAMPEEIVNVQQLEADFNRVKADAEKEKAQTAQEGDKTAAK